MTPFLRVSGVNPRSWIWFLGFIPSFSAGFEGHALHECIGTQACSSEIRTADTLSLLLENGWCNQNKTEKTPGRRTKMWNWTVPKLEMNLLSEMPGSVFHEGHCSLLMVDRSRPGILEQKKLEVGFQGFKVWGPGDLWMYEECSGISCQKGPNERCKHQFSAGSC